MRVEFTQQDGIGKSIVSRLQVGRIWEEMGKRGNMIKIYEENEIEIKLLIFNFKGILKNNALIL